MRHASRAASWMLAVLATTMVLGTDALAQPRTVPQYVGLPRAEVERRLIKGGFAAQWRSAGAPQYPEDKGRIAAQVPTAGNPLPSGAPVILFVYDDGASAQQQPAAPRPASPAAAPPAAPAAPPDCSRWPGSNYDKVLGACRCAEGKWWGLRGDRCESREKAAGDVCASKWAGSVPVFTGSGSFHCTCPPERPWNGETMECGAPSREVAAECQSRWPGTVPVMSPSGTDYECRCPMGMRWEESRSRCDASVAVEGHGLAPASPSPQAVPGAPRGESSLTPPPVEDEGWDEAPPGRLEEGNGADGGEIAPRAAPGGGEDSYEDEVPYPARRNEAADSPPSPSGYGDDSYDAPPPRSGAGIAPSEGPAGTPPPRPGYTPPAAHEVPMEGAEDEGPCGALLAEIRGRAGAGQRAEADNLALRAATKGCDPAAIADAVSAGPPQ